MAINHIPQLVEALQRGRLALFVGADLPQAATGLPSRADLAAELAERLGVAAPAPPWPEIAARYEASAGLNALITWLRDQLETAGQGPGPVHDLLAQLPATTYLTTAYDTRLHDALREAGRRPNLPVVDASSLGLLDAGRPTVVHLFGTYDRPDSLVLTAAHLRQLPQTKAQILAGLVHPTLANRSVLVVGQDLRDTHFQTLYQTALFQAGTIRPSAYASWPGLEEWETQTWLSEEVRVVDRSAMDLLGELAGQPQATSLPPSPPGTPPEGIVRPPEPLQFERLHIDPKSVPYAAIRDLLEAAFTPETLRRFCQDRPAFEPLLRRFGPTDGLASLVAKVLEYCRTELLWDDLLAEVAGANPRQYARFESSLRG
jgi:hypothetical protein